MSELRRTIISASGSIDLSEYLLKEEAETLYATLDLVSLKANDTAVVHKVGDESIAGTKTFNGLVHFLGTARPTYEGVNLAILSDISSKQDTLVSGTNIKTINGQTILGSGDIAISGGSDANVQAVDTGDVLDDVTVDYATKTYVDGLVGDINSILESIISGGGSNEITFYINDGVYVTPMKALSGMTWEEFVNSEYANQNSMFTNFRLFSMVTYYGVKFYHEEAMGDLTLYKNDSYQSNVEHSKVIEDGETYSAH